MENVKNWNWRGVKAAGGNPGVPAELSAGKAVLALSQGDCRSLRDLHSHSARACRIHAKKGLTRLGKGKKTLDSDVQ